MSTAQTAQSPQHATSPTRLLEKRDPVSGASQGEFPIADKAEVEAAVARARAAFPAWRDTPLAERTARLDRLRDVLIDGAEDIARRISEDTGKPRGDVLLTEVLPTWLLHDFNRKQAPKVLGRHKVKTPIVMAGKTSYVEYFPRGVIGVISPWNFPLQLSMAPVLSALIGGNTVVLKPSEVTPLTGYLVAELLARLELPEGVVEVVHGDGSTGAALTEADIDMIFFTGSVATGRRVMAAAAKKPIPVELELGGKDAMIVCADAPLERAARGAVWGGLVNCGQVCVSVERVFVVEEIHDRFVELCKQEIEKLRVGGPDDDADVGPMIFGRQLETVERHVKAALEDGAELITGGARLDRPGQFYAPTLLAGVTPEMAVYREETFGPVLGVIKVRDEDEAVRLANDHEFGLNGSVWTRDIRKGMRLASRLECGQATVNDLISSVANPSLPFGGVKSSGLGRYHGVDGLRAFQHTRGIMVDRGVLGREPGWFPNAGKYPAALELVRGIIGKRLTKTARALVSIARSSFKDE